MTWMLGLATLYAVAAGTVASGARSPGESLCSPRTGCASTVLQQLHMRGARATLGSLYSNQAAWGKLLANVGKGERAWLEVAEQLRRASDAGASEQLDLAIGEALVHNPEWVLKASQGGLDLRSVCSGPDVDDPRYDSYEAAIEAIRKREKAVRGVQTPALRDARKKCREALEEAAQSIATFYGRATK